VKEAIYLVLKLELLERAKRHLELNAQDYRKELKKISNDELRVLVEKAEQARADREKTEHRKSELVKEKESARRKIENIELKLRDTQNGAALQRDREQVTQDLELRQAEFTQTLNQIRELTPGAYYVFAQPIVDYSLEILDEKRERGEIPSSIRQQFVQDLLVQMRCICGRSFTEGSPEFAHLRELLNSSVSDALADKLTETSSALRPFRERLDRLREDLDKAITRRIEVRTLIHDLELRLDELSRQLKGIPLEDIKRLEEQRQEYLADVDSNTLESGGMAERIRIFNEEIERYDKEIGKAQKNEKRVQVLTTKLQLAERSAEAIGDMYQTFADAMRQRIQAKTKEIFKLLVWKESHFQDVKLGSDFNLEVIDRYGLPARPDLSAGERQVLSLSFITAMSRISEEEAPLVMDTPFGRLSSQPRNNITRYLPDLADQLVLFVTDEELRDEARKNIEPRIGAEYRLVFDSETSVTTIEEVRY
jgi:DNA sulfur modification protein DndD